MLIPKGSPVYEGSGFTKDDILISFRDEVTLRLDSDFVLKCGKVGILDTSKDKRVGDEINRMIKYYKETN